MQIEIINSFVHSTLCKYWSKERVGRVQRFDVLKTQNIDFESCKKACVFARQGVRYHIFFALLVFDNVRKRLHELNPFCVPFTQVGLALKIFQRLMVGMDDKFFGPKIVLPHLKNSNQGKKFFVINGIIEACAIKFLTMVSNRMSILHKDATNANTTSVTFNLKGFCEIRQCKKWFFGEPLFELIKSLLLCFSPNERDIFLGQFVEGASNGRKVFHITTVKSNQPMKTTKFINTGGYGPIS